MRETFHVNMLSIEAALYVNSVSRNAKCSIPSSNVTISIIDLRKSDVQCETAVSGTTANFLPSYWTVVTTFLGFRFRFFAQAF